MAASIHLKIIPISTGRKDRLNYIVSKSAHKIQQNDKNTKKRVICLDIMLYMCYNIKNML